MKNKLVLFAAFVIVICFMPAVSGQKVDIVEAQGGQDPTDKQNSIDFYPDPLASGALAFSLRDPWNKTDLNYYFHNCPSRLDCDSSRQAIRIAFETWANVSALTFTEAANANEADIEVLWIGRNDPEGVLGSPGGTLAYAYFPRYGGDLFIDDSEPWTLGDGGEFDMVITAVHEIGHAIGLGHSEFTTAIMYPYAGYAVELGQDDLRAVQELYGPPNGTTPTATNPDINTGSPANNVPTEEDVVEVAGTIDNSQPYEIWDIEVTAGESVTVTMAATGGNLDAYIGILNPNLSEVLIENDDFGNSTDAQVTYTFTQPGTYSVVATRYGFEDGTSSGSYALTFSFNQGAGGGDDNVEPDNGTVVWRISNYADTELCYIYFSPSDSETWGPDQLEAEQSLRDNFFFDWQVPTGTYDLQVWDCFGNKLERYSINANRDIDIQVFADAIDVVPLGTDADTNPPEPDILTWRIVNYADTDLCEVYFSSTEAPEWGENKIDGVLADDESREWTLEPGSYDIQVWDCFGNSLEEREVIVRQDTEMQVYADQMLVVPLN